MGTRHLVGLLALTLACGTTAPSAHAPPPSATPPAASHVAASPSPSSPAAPASAPGAPKMPEGWPYAPQGTAPSAHGAVTSDAALATKVGVAILESGGNAADAAVAVAFALAVVYPTAGNIGGGGFAVARIGDETRALDFRETAPASAARDMFVDASGKPNGGSREGYKASGVPGSVAGLWELHHALGSKNKTWSDVIAPAIKLAEQGFTVDEEFTDALEWPSERMRKNPASLALFFPNGQAPKVGNTWKNPDLAVVLKRIADKGPAGFYEGPTAVAIASDMKKNGGLITLADLKGYKAKWRAPLEITYRGHTITSMPPPSSGGVTIGMICHILEGYDLAKMGWHSPEELHYVFEAMRRSFAARNAKLGDPDFVKNPVDELLGATWSDAQRATISPTRATPSSEIAGATPSGNGPHTTHFSVVDAQGGAVALTTTLNWFYGNGITIPGTGMVMNNEMDDFASVPGTANGFGLVQGEPNAIAPGKRMLSSMSPTLVRGKDGRVEMVVGAAGGPMIITTVFQILSNVIDYGLDPGTAVAAPRFHMQHLPDRVLHEKFGLPADLQKPLAAMGYNLEEVKRDHIADAVAIGRVPLGWIASGEPRRKGSLGAGF
jgi:gamma-glutamyltranspeptidase/glutathione hydrolase